MDEPKVGDAILVVTNIKGVIVRIEEADMVGVTDEGVVVQRTKIYYAKLEDRGGLAMLPRFMFKVAKE